MKRFISFGRFNVAAADQPRKATSRRLAPTICRRASMWPRLISRGKAGDWMQIALRSSRFNVAAADQPRKVGLNEKMRVIYLARFNVAAADQPRKGHLINQLIVAALISLQCGRG